MADKIRGYKRRELLLALAKGEETQSAIARRTGVTPAAISQFAARNADEIEAVVQELMDNAAEEFAGLWVAKKVNRVAEYQSLIEEQLALLIAKTGYYNVPENRDRLVKTLGLLLRSVAEEMGQLKYVASLEQKVVKYTIEGINPEDLK